MHVIQHDLQDPLARQIIAGGHVTVDTGEVNGDEVLMFSAEVDEVVE